jgi:hypothetical protein
MYCKELELNKNVPVIEKAIFLFLFFFIVHVPYVQADFYF